MSFCGKCGQSFGAVTSAAPAPAVARREPASFGRILITPIITTLAGYLVFGIYGLALGAGVGILYVLVASSRR